MQLKKLSALLAVPTLALALSACGSDSVSKKDFVDGFKKASSEFAKGKVTDEQLSKIAECIYDKASGKISDSTMKKLAEGDKNAKISSKDQKEISKSLAECAKDAMLQK